MGLTLPDKLEWRVFGEMCFLSRSWSEAGQEASELFNFWVIPQIPWGVSWARHPLVHEVSAASATSFRTNSQGQGEAMLLELLAELVLALLCQSSYWVANKEKILRSSPMWPQFSVSCVHLKLTFKFWGNALLCGSLSVWGDFTDYKFSKEAQLYQKLINCQSPGQQFF